MITRIRWIFSGDNNQQERIAALEQQVAALEAQVRVLEGRITTLELECKAGVRGQG